MYTVNSLLMYHHHYSLTELENMMVWERDIYVAFVNQYEKERKEHQDKQDREMKAMSSKIKSGSSAKPSTPRVPKVH